MSLDVYLIDPTATYNPKELYSANITHNLNKMADQSGLYEALWRPSEIGAIKAKDIIEIVEEGLARLKSNRVYFKTFDSENGWGTYEHFVPFVENYLNALKEYPESIIQVSR